MVIDPDFCHTDFAPVAAGAAGHIINSPFSTARWYAAFGTATELRRFFL